MTLKTSLKTTNYYNYSTTAGLTIEDCRHKLAQYAKDNTAVLAMFDHFADCLSTNPQFPTSDILEAVLFAAEKHKNGTRKDLAATPYIIHPIGVALSVWEEGKIQDRDTLIAALLHDTLEDTDTTKEEIAARFGSHVSDVVFELTNPPGLASEAKKEWQIQHAPSLSYEARIVKLADRLYNLRDLKTPPPAWTEQKVKEYYGWGEKLLHVLEGTNPNLENLLKDEIAKQRL